MLLFKHQLAALSRLPYIFNQEFVGSPEFRVERLRKNAARAGIQVEGDAESGRFSGHGLRGTYRFKPNLVEVTIEALPPLRGVKKAERQIQDFLRS